MNNFNLYKKMTVLSITLMWAVFVIGLTGCGAEKKPKSEVAPLKREFSQIAVGNSAQSNDITALLPGTYSNGKGLFIGTSNGLYFYSADSKEVKQVLDVENSLKGIKVLSLCQEEGGKIWIGSNKGIYSFNSSTVRNYDEGEAQAIIQTASGEIWAGTRYGLILYDGSKGFTRFNRKNDGLPDDNIVCFTKEDKVRSIYAGTKQGIAVIDGPKLFTAKTGTSMKPLNDGSLITEPGNTDMAGNTISAIAINSKGVMYIGTNMGLNRCKGFSNWTVFSADSEIPAKTADGLGYKKVQGNSQLLSNWIRAIYIDPEDGLWIGTKIGLSYFNGDNKWENYTAMSGLASNNITAVTGIGTAVYIGTQSGLNVFDFPKKAAAPDSTKK